MHIYELKTWKLYFKSVLYFHSKRLPLELKDLHLIQLQGVENTFTLGLFPTEQSIINLLYHCLQGSKEVLVRNWSDGFLRRLFYAT